MKRCFSLLLLVCLLSRAAGQGGVAAELKTIVENWLARATAAANNGNIDSMRSLGEFYNSEWLGKVTGKYDPNPWRNVATSLQWYDKGRYLGCRTCYWDLAYVALTNNYAPNPISIDTIVSWLQMAEPQNENVLFALGNTYQYGKHDLAKATEAYTKAAALGSKVSADRLTEIERSKQNAWEMAEAAWAKNDTAGSLKWYKVAAEYQKNGKAAYRVGVMCDSGYVGWPDPVAALSWYKLAGQLGDPRGWFEAGNYYYRKWEKETDAGKASGYYSQAIEQWDKGIALGNDECRRGKYWLVRQDREKTEALTAKERRKREQALTTNGSATTNQESSTQAPAQTKSKTWCTECHGSGRVSRIEYYTDKRSGLQSARTVYDNCGRCYGKGYY